jgi:hypothetical protein
VAILYIGRTVSKNKEKYNEKDQYSLNEERKSERTKKRREEIISKRRRQR